MQKEKNAEVGIEINYKVLGTCVSVALILMFVFIFSVEAPEQHNTSLNLKGTWKVAAQISNGSTVLPMNDFFVFDETIADNYRSDQTDTYATSKYTLSSDSTYPNHILVLGDIGRSYTVTPFTDNYIRLYSSQSEYIELIRYANYDMSPVDYDKTLINGIWNVTYRNTAEIIAEEKLEFTDSELLDYRNGEEEPTVISAYSWNENNCLVAEVWGMEMICVPLSENVVFLVETATGYVWELTRAE